MTRKDPQTPQAAEGRPGPGLGAQGWAVRARWVAAVVFVVFGVAKFINHAPELASFRYYGLPWPGAFVYAIGALEIAGGLLLASRQWVRPAALALAADMVGAIVLSGVGRGELISLTLAPVLLLAPIFVARFTAPPTRPRPSVKLVSRARI